MLLASLGLGLLIGLVIGALGGGGSVLTVPALVFALGLAAQEATTASLIIVGVTAVVASVGYARAGNTRWGTGLLLGAAGVPASVLGTRLNRLIDPNVLLLAFALLMLVAAAGMLLQSPAGDAVEPKPAATRPGRAPLRLLAAGLGIGFLTGFLGVGGGFVIVPVLVLVLGFPMPAAVGTSLLVIALNSGVALLARAGHSAVTWQVVAPFTVASIAGALLGKRAAARMGGGALTRAFAVLLVAVAVYVAVRALLALT